MLAPKRASSQKVIALVAILLVSLVGMGWLVLTNFVKGKWDPIPTQWTRELQETSRVQFAPVPVLEPNPAIFDRPEFTRRRLPVRLPVEAGAIGRENPFAPPAFLAATTTQ